MTWKETTLGEVMTLQRGHDLPEAQRRDGSIPVVSSSGITGFHAEAKARRPGVVTGRYGTLGRVFYLDEDYWPLNTALYVIDFKGNDPRFVAYLLEHTLKNYQSDKAAVPGVNRNVLHQLKVHIPERPKEQSVIAEGLGSYDDLIETNRRRIELIGQAASLRYREWFIKYQFPGHEHTSMSGGRPRDWSERPLMEVATPTYGHPFRSNLFNENADGVPVARIRDILEGQSTTYTLEEGPPDRKLQNGDLLIGMDGEFHMGIWTGGDAWLNQRVVRFRGKGEVADYLLLWMLSEPVRRFNDTLTGTTVVHLGAKELKTIQLTLPPRRILEHANDFFALIGSQIVTLRLQNRQLSTARDLLLPRVMSGGVRFPVVKG